VRHAKAVGADAALVVTPYYVRPSQEGLYLHYKAINDAVELPVLVYNVPGRTGVDISNETLARLAKLPNIVGIKDATGDLTRASQQRIMCGADWVMLSGDDPTALGYMAHGGHGVISVTANVAPDACARLHERLPAGRLGDRPLLAGPADQPAQVAVPRRSPAPTKFALAQLGLCSRGRPPADRALQRRRPPADLDAMRDAGVI
jgi:4-hydroxy-tetrahydrodipicolinate synthase